MNSYKPQNPIRIVTAASLFDGHDASINIMRRILQDFGARSTHFKAFSSCIATTLFCCRPKKRPTS